jgi:hypothetical protein
MREVQTPAVLPAEVDPARTNLLEMFQFMIGNTDWSAYVPSQGTDECCHNGRVLEPRDGGGKYVVVPFDFDNSGLIDAKYAAVSPSVGVRRVRQRIYRGLCTNNAHLPASISRFQQVRPQMEALFTGGGLDGAASRRALRYVEEFYEIIDDPAATRRRIYDACRSGREVPATPPAAGTADAASSDDGSFGRAP